MPSRRRLLTGLVGGAVVGAVAGTSVSLGPVGSWAPDADTWPLRRFDPANTASSPAVAPTAPAVRWRRRVLSRDRANTVVLGPERVYVASDGVPRPPHGAVAALDRGDGSVRWSAGTDAGSLALFDGRLYAGPADDDLGGLTVYDAATGESVAEAPTRGVGERGHLLVGPDGVFLGGQNALTGRDHDGERRWRRVGSGRGVPAVADGRLFAGGGYDVARFDPRRLGDVVTGGPPTLDWATDYGSGPTTVPPAVAGGRVLAPGAVRRERSDGGTAALALLGPQTGAVTARALDGGATRATCLAADAERALVGLRRDAGDDSTASGGTAALALLGPQTGAVTARALDGGATRATCLAADAERALVGTADAGPTGGTVTAVESTTGTERWRVGLPAGVRALAPGDGSVFATLRDGSVVAVGDGGDP
jgi:outer membrane protein assembly factor BamB